MNLSQMITVPELFDDSLLNVLFIAAIFVSNYKGIV